MRRTEITMNKPIYVGLAVLDLSKILMYDFYYSYMMEVVDSERCKLLYMDTDSFVYHIRDTDLYEIMNQDISHFDTSDYPKDNRFQLPRTKKRVGLMKD